MVKKERNYKINKNILLEYQNNALHNAYDILVDAKMLLENKSFARSYFLSCSSIEETGKAYIAFSSLGRNLGDHGLQSVLKVQFENHQAKVVAAFICWTRSSNNIQESVKEFLDIALHLQIGREKSMYVDISEDNIITLPAQVVRPKAAEDCIKIAEKCYTTTKDHITTNTAEDFTSFQDKIFCFHSNKLKSLFNTDDFWEYLISNFKKDASDFDFAKYTVRYHDQYFSKSKKYIRNSS